MKKLIAAAALLPFLLFQCKPTDKQEGNEVSTDSLTTIAAGDTTGYNTAYQQALDQLPDETASLRKGLELFKSQFLSTDPSMNDRSLKTYLEFHDTILEVLNNKYMSRPDYDRINNLYNADSLQYTFEGKVLEQEFLDNGLMLGSGEGQSYIKIDPKLTRTYFYEYLTPASKMYFDEFEKEVNKMDTDDGGLLISVDDVAERLGIWDTYITSYPNALFADHAKAKAKHYLRILLSGLDNTPAFNSEDQKLSPEYLTAYHLYLNKYPKTPSAQILTDYQTLLSKTDMAKSPETEAFVEKYAAY